MANRRSILIKSAFGVATWLTLKIPDRDILSVISGNKPQTADFEMFGDEDY